ncbi:hypothetical protein LBMAG42_50060 [Deltaproteobacteria bacterium]|nr:hypothetical protein LBMAG42_50060 [Deltaproteobacteria bacterium]
MPCTPADAAALQNLLALSIPERIVVVRADVKSRADRYAWMKAHDLAKALGIEDSRSPGNDWSRETQADDLTVEEYAEQVFPPSTVLDWLTPSARRAKVLAKKGEQIDASGVLDFGFLTDKERDTIEAAIDADQLESNASNGMGCIATIGVGEELREYSGDEPARNPGESDDDYLLRMFEAEEDNRVHFEGQIEDDGECIFLKTPYDLRDEEPDRPVKISRSHW